MILKNKKTATFLEPVQLDTDEMELRRSTRANRGGGVTRMVPTMGGKSHIDIQEVRGSGHKSNFQAMQFIQRDRRLKKHNKHPMMNRIIDLIFTQMSAAKCLKLFGERAVSAIFNKFIQIDKGVMKDNPVFLPVEAKSLTAQEKKEALPAVNLIKEKRTGKLKGRTCANGRKQHLYLKEDESVAPPLYPLSNL